MLNKTLGLPNVYIFVLLYIKICKYYERAHIHQYIIQLAKYNDTLKQRGQKNACQFLTDSAVCAPVFRSSCGCDISEKSATAILSFTSNRTSQTEGEGERLRGWLRPGSKKNLRIE